MELFPIIDIQDFRAKQLSGNENFSYSELKGIHHIERPHRHHFFLLALFEQAEGIHTIDFNTYKIDNRQIHVLFPNQVHTWKLEEHTIGYQLMVDREHFEKFSSNFPFSLAYYQRNPVISLSEPVFDTLLYEFKAIQNELNDKDFLPEVIHARTAVIISTVSKEIKKLFSSREDSQYSARLVKFHELIEEFFREEKSISFYAEKLNISTSYLTKVCRAQLKTSPTQLILQRTLLESKRLLKSTNLSIKEIAFDLGFIDAPYFSNFFRQHIGITPKQFRDH